VSLLVRLYQLIAHQHISENIKCIICNCMGLATIMLVHLSRLAKYCKHHFLPRLRAEMYPLQPVFKFQLKVRLRYAGGPYR